MGKLKVGYNGIDRDGDSFTVVRKRKGFRDVLYHNGAAAGSVIKWMGVESLVPANDNISAEIGDVAFSSEGWVPKVGDRVRYVGNRGLNAKWGALATVDGEFDGTYMSVAWVRDGRDNGQNDGKYYPEGFEPAPLTIEAGKFYRTRDGRKVGPMRSGHLYGGRPFEGLVDGVFNVSYWQDGREWEKEESQSDLVAEWVEPTAWQSATEEPEAIVAEPKFKVGDVVDYGSVDTSWNGTVITKVEPKPDGQHYYEGTDRTQRLGGFIESELRPAEPAAPPAKFKVGDRVVVIKLANGWADGGSGHKKPLGFEATLTKFTEMKFWRTDKGVDFYPHEIALAPENTLPIGSTVTFTATGRLSAINENGHYQVTFPGLAPGQNSFALPDKYVSPAN